MTFDPQWRLLRRVRLIIVAGGLPILLLLVGLAYAAYVEARRSVLDEHRQAALACKAGLEQLAAVVRHHVETMRDFLAYRLEQAVASVVTDASEANVGESGGVRGLVVRAPGNADPSARADLAAAEALLPLLNAAHQTLPQLRWSYVFDAQRRFMTMYPFAELSTFRPPGVEPAAFYASWFEYEIFQAATPARNPNREPYWTPAYADAAGAGLMVSHGAPVSAGGRFRAMVGTDVLLSHLSTYLASFSAVAGRFALADQAGNAIATPHGATGGSPDLIPVRQVLGHGLPGVPGVDGFIWADGDQVLALAIAGTPWTLLHVLPEAVVRRAAMQKVSPFVALACGIVVGLGALYAALSWQFIWPAARLAAFVEESTARPGVPPPPVPLPWQPSIARVAVSFAEQRRLADELLAAERLHGAVLNAALDAVVIADGAGHVLSFNVGGERIFGWTMAQAVGRSISELMIPPPMRAAHERGMERLQRTGEARVLGRRLEVEATRADGTVFPAELAIQRVVTVQGTVFAAYIRDLTTQYEAATQIEAQRKRISQVEKLSAMGSLLAGVAHELNNPLGILLAHAVLLREKAGSPDVRQRAERIHAAAERAGRIVKSFLAMARQEAPRREPIELNAVVQMALEMTAYGARSGGIEVVTDLDPALPRVMADRDLLCQVISNLVINAQQALLDRPHPRHISIVTGYGGARNVIVEVADNGLGVAPELVDRIFEPYFTTKPAGSGTGIGLAISRSVVEAHGGDIKFQKAPSGGALFRVRLPLGVAAAPMTQSTSGSDGSLAVLVVDDEPDLAAGLAEMLETLGHHVTVAASPMDALGRVREMYFDIVMADLRMPAMNGLELRQRLDQIIPGLGARTVIVTGDTMIGTMTIPDGMIVLEKPFSLGEVRTIVSTVIMPESRLKLETRPA